MTTCRARLVCRQEGLADNHTGRAQNYENWLLFEPFNWVIRLVTKLRTFPQIFADVGVLANINGEGPCYISTPSTAAGWRGRQPGQKHTPPIPSASICSAAEADTWSASPLETMQVLKNINLVLAFLLELGMFFSISYWGFLQGKSTLTKWTTAIICLAISVTLWGIFASPSSQSRLTFPIRLIFELSMFLLASFLLYKLNFTVLSLGFALLSIASVTIAFIFKQ